MKTSEFKTKTIFMDKKSPNFTPAVRPMALDIGYSAVKGFSEDMVFSFPSYALKLGDMPTTIAQSEARELYYKGEDEEVWVVGTNAQSMLSSSSVNDNITTLYGRNRYFSDMFRVIADVGIAFGMLSGLNGEVVNKQPILQTGLPPAYIKSDALLLKEALSGKRKFQLKIGAGKWIRFEYELAPEHIFIMPQPMGTLTSITTKNDGTPTQDASSLYKSSLVICDPGFGTFDTFHIKNNMIMHSDTSDNLGMKQVLQNTCDNIFKAYGVEIQVPAMQPYLESGMIKQLDRRTMRSVSLPFDDILEKESRKVCMQAIERMKEVYNYFLDVDYLALTGGTGAAWSNYIREYLREMDTLTILSGNRNDPLPYIFNNVRGYYMFLINYLKRNGY